MIQRLHVGEASRTWISGKSIEAREENPDPVDLRGIAQIVSEFPHRDFKLLLISTASGNRYRLGVTNTNTGSNHGPPNRGLEPC